MARRSSPALAEDDLFLAEPLPKRQERAPRRDSDQDEAEESPFLRGQNRVPVRRGPLPKKTARRLWWAALSGLLCLAVLFSGYEVYLYGKHNWHFRIESGDNIMTLGNAAVTRSQIMDVMGGDIGRNIFFVPLAQRQQQLEQLPWVESAAVMRFTPNQLRIEIRERKPVAFARVGSRILLIDATGHLLEPPAAMRGYKFPVITGMVDSEPLSTRAARMKVFAQLVHELDATGARYSQDLSEVDLSDPEDVRITAPDQGGEVLLHLGTENFLERYQLYMTHLAAWRQQFSKLDSVDLRYDGQVIVNAGEIREEIRQPVAEDKPVQPGTTAATAAPPAHKATLKSGQKTTSKSESTSASTNQSGHAKSRKAALAKAAAAVAAKRAAAAKAASSAKPPVKSEAVQQTSPQPAMTKSAGKPSAGRRLQ